MRIAHFLAALLAFLLALSLCGCASSPATAPLPTEQASALAPYVADLNESLAVAQSEPCPPPGPGLERAVKVAQLLQATVGPAKPTGLCPDQIAERMAAIPKIGLEAAEREAREREAAARWERDRSMFWYVLLAGLVGSAVCIAWAPLRSFVGYPAMGGAGAAAVLVLGAAFRQVVGNLAGGLWALLPVLALLAALGGTCVLLWLWFRRERKTLDAVQDGVQKLDKGAKAAIEAEATEAGVEPHLHDRLVRRGYAKKEPEAAPTAQSPPTE